MKLSENFSLWEFECHDGTPVPPELIPVVQRLVASALQPMRDHFKAPVSIVSGYRTCAWNAKVGGAENSVHLTAGAADIRVLGFTPSEVTGTIMANKIPGILRNLGGIGTYKTWVHVDIRRVGIGRIRQWKGAGVGSEQPNTGGSDE